VFISFHSVAHIRWPRRRLRELGRADEPVDAPHGFVLREHWLDHRLPALVERSPAVGGELLVHSVLDPHVTSDPGRVVVRWGVGGG
jgi:hypothetical protein